MTATEVIKKLCQEGWQEKLPRKKGSHRQFVHPTKPGKVAVPMHKGKDIPIGTLRAIEEQSGVSLR